MCYSALKLATAEVLRYMAHTKQRHTYLPQKKVGKQVSGDLVV